MYSTRSDTFAWLSYAAIASYVVAMMLLLGPLILPILDDLLVLIWTPRGRWYSVGETNFYHVYRNTTKKHLDVGGNSSIARNTKHGQLVKLECTERKGMEKWFYAWKMETCAHNSIEGVMSCPNHPCTYPGVERREWNDIWRREMDQKYGLGNDYARTYGIHSIRFVPLTIFGWKVPMMDKGWREQRIAWTCLCVGCIVFVLSLFRAIPTSNTRAVVKC